MQDMSPFVEMLFRIDRPEMPQAYALLCPTGRSMVWAGGWGGSRSSEAWSSRGVWRACVSDDVCFWSGAKSVALDGGTGDLQQWCSSGAAAAHICCSVCHSVLMELHLCTWGAHSCSLHRWQDVFRAHHCFKSVAINVPRVPVHGAVYGDTLTENSQRRISQPEQESKALINDVHKVYEACSAGVDSIFWDISTTGRGRIAGQA